MKGLSGLAIFLIGILLVVGVAYYGIIPGAIPSGFTTIGLSQADFRTTGCEGNFFCGSRWVLTVVQGGLGQYAEGKITKEQIGSQSGEKPNNDFAIKIEYADQSCEYVIKKDTSATQVYRYTIHEYTSGTPQQACPNGVFYAAKYVGLGAPFFCVEKTKTTGAIEPNIEDAYVRTTAKIMTDTDSIKSGSPAFNFDTLGNTQGWVVPNQVYFIYNGDLVRGNCPDPDRYYAFYEAGTWKIGSRSRYDTYKIKETQSYNDLNAICAGIGYSCTIQDVANIVGGLNSASIQAVWLEQFGEVQNATKLDGAKVKHSLGYLVNAPLYTFFVKAEWLGIFQPSPDISIQSARLPQCVRTYGNLEITLRNDGETGNARVSVSCTSPFSSASPAREVGVQGGYTQNILFPITVNTDRSVTGTCTITVTDAFHTRTTTISVCGEPETVCDPGKQTCVNNAIMKCNAFGSGWDLFKQCGEEQVCDYDNYGIPYCRDKNVPPPPDPWAWLITFLTMWIVGTILALIILFVFGYVFKLSFILPIFRDLRMLLLISAGLGLLIAVVFAVPVASIAASIF